MPDKNILILLLVLVIIVPISSDKSLQNYQNTNALDYIEYLQNEKTLQEKVAQMKQLQIMAETKRQEEKVDMNSEDKVKEEMNKLNDSLNWQPNWPDVSKNLGSVSAVSLDTYGNVWVFHRGDRVWNAQTFLIDNVYAQRDKGPIKQNTIVCFHKQTGKVLNEWGKDLFYMPHGLTIDDNKNVWITDVALHQVMKFGPNAIDDPNPLLVLGKSFKPGNTRETFCKPSAVAVLKDGDFFVADGYCNARIIKFSKTGDRILSWGSNTFQGKAVPYAPPNFFAIPHSLTLANDLGLICVADRENGRVQCFHTTNGTFHSQFHSPVIGDRLFSCAYTNKNGGQLYVVNGPMLTTYHEIKGFIIDFKTGKVIGKFGPNNKEFANPHDIVISPDGSEIYVAELNPNKVYKFINTLISNETIIHNVKPTATLDDLTLTSAIPTTILNKGQNGSTALIIVCIFTVFALITFGIVLVISRRRKRGCLPFANRNRRHAWEFPTVKPENFKLGSLLDRKRGFEKLNQDASEDEEPNVTTNMLQQYA